MATVLALIGGLILLVAVLLPGVTHCGAPVWKVKCGSNLRQIGQSMRQYALDNDGDFPRTRYDPSDPTPRFFTGVMASDPFGEDGPAANDVTAAWFHLLRESDLTAEIFICPTDADAEPMAFGGGKGRRAYSNFAGRRFLGYSMANPYPPADVEGFAWDSRLPSTFALGGDLNPGTAAPLLTTAVDAPNKAMKRVNSPNHGGEGQNVLFADGSVRFVQSPFEGALKDNVYTAGPAAKMNELPPIGVAVVSPPLAALDSILLPTADATPRVAGYDVPVAFADSPAGRAFAFWILLPTLVLGSALLLLLAFLAIGRRQGRAAADPPRSAFWP